MGNTKYVASYYRYPGISTDQCRLVSSHCWVVVAVTVSCLTGSGTG